MGGTKDVAEKTGRAIGAAATTVGQQVGCGAGVAGAGARGVASCSDQLPSFRFPQAIEIDHKLRISERATAASTAIKESAVGRSTSAAFTKVLTSEGWGGGGGGGACVGRREGGVHAWCMPCTPCCSACLLHPLAGATRPTNCASRTVAALSVQVGAALGVGTKKVLENEKVGGLASDVGRWMCKMECWRAHQGHASACSCWGVAARARAAQADRSITVRPRAGARRNGRGVPCACMHARCAAVDEPCPPPTESHAGCWRALRPHTTAHHPPAPHQHAPQPSACSTPTHPSLSTLTHPYLHRTTPCALPVHTHPRPLPVSTCTGAHRHRGSQRFLQEAGCLPELADWAARQHRARQWRGQRRRGAHPAGG